MTEEKVDIVNDSDKVVGQKKKSECHKKGLMHRAATVLVFNKNGELLVQKRSPKVARPNLLCSSASGHVLGESYQEAAQRELEEELGIKKCDLKKIGKYKLDVTYFDGMVDKEFYMLYVCQYDGEIILDGREVSSIRFLSVDKIKKMIKENKEQFTPGFRQEFQHYLDYSK